MLSRDAVNDQLWARIEAQHEQWPPGPVFGVENEFYVSCNGRKVDFRALVGRLAALDDVPPFFLFRDACLLSTGSQLSADRSCAEMATAPAGLDRAGLSNLSEAVLWNRNHLVELLERFQQDAGGAWRVEGASTHYNLHHPDPAPWRFAQVLLRTVMPAYTLLTDRPVAGGMMLRPRSHRIEIAGDYIPDADYHRAVMLYVAATYLFLMAAVRNGALEQVPFELLPGRMTRPRHRRGYALSRRSYGGGLHRKGRSAVLRARLPSGERTRVLAQDVLETFWALARDEAAVLAGPEELARVDDIVAGTAPLAIEEATPGLAYFDVRPVSTDWAPEGLARIYGEAISPHRYGDLVLEAERVSWNGIRYGIQREDAVVSATVHRVDLEAVSSLLADGEFQELVDGFRSAPDRRTHGRRERRRTRFTKSRRREPADGEVPGKGGKKGGAKKVAKKKPRPKKKPKIIKKGGKDTCSVTLLRAETDRDPPIVEACVPATRDGLRPTKPQEPPTNPSFYASNVFLHNGSFNHERTDLAVRAMGFDFAFTRHYRSAVDYDGVMGKGWDHVYNKRVVPTRPGMARSFDEGWCELYTGPFTSRSGDLYLYDGTGRRTFHAFESWEHRQLRKMWDGHGLTTFRAVVTSYKVNPGERFQIQRYAVYEGPYIWGDPIYYVRRHFDGAEEIYNCHGYIVAWRDAKRNTKRFKYGRPNPATRYRLLEEIVDPSKRKYALEYATIAGVLRVVLLRDEWGRAVEFIYNDQGELTDVVGPGNARYPESRHTYRYAGRPGLLAELVEPNEAAPTAAGHSVVHTTYDGNERVETQRVGTPPGVAPACGGTFAFEYNGDWVSAVKDRAGDRTEFTFVPKHDTYVLTRRAIQHTQLPIPGVTRTEPSEYATEYEYNDDFQVIQVKRAGGVREEFLYELFDSQVTQGDERDSLRPEFTWANNLARGNLLEHHVHPARPGVAKLSVYYEYEPLFNQVKVAHSPLGKTEYTFRNGYSATPHLNTNPLETLHPPTLNPDGTPLQVRETCQYGPGGLPVRHEDPDGLVTTFDYHESGAVAVVVVDPGGKAIKRRLNRDPRGNPIEVIDERQERTDQVYDDRDNLIERKGPLGHVARFEYDHQDQLERTEVPVADLRAPFSYRGMAARTLVRVREYNLLGQEIALTTDPGGLNLRTERDFDAEGREVLVRTARATGQTPDDAAAVIIRTYTSRGLAHSQTYAPGHADESVSYKAYSPDGYTELMVTPTGGQWSYEYDGLNRVEVTRNPIGVATRIDRNDAGQPIRTRVFGPVGGPSPTDRAGSGSRLLSDVTYAYDAAYRVVKETALAFDPAAGPGVGAQRLNTERWYTPGGQLLRVVDAEGRVTKHGYDSAGRLETVTRPGGHSITYELDATGNILKETHVERQEGYTFFRAPRPVTTVVRREYNELGQLTRETNPGRPSTCFARDTQGRVRAVRNPSGTVQHTEYDLAGRVSRRLMAVDSNPFNPLGQITQTITYTANGQPETIEDGAGNTTTYEYDPLDRVRAIVDPDGIRSEVDVDQGGRPVLATMRGGEQIQSTYDLAGRLIRREHLNPASGVPLVATFELDGVGRITKATDSASGITTDRRFNSMGWLMREAHDGLRMDMGYDFTGLPRRIAYPSGMALDIELTPSGKPGSIRRSQILMANYAYVGDRPYERMMPSMLTDPTGTAHVFPLIRQTQYGPGGRLERLRHLVYDDVTTPSSPNIEYLLRPVHFDYDGDGQLERKRSPDFAQTFMYDDAGRVESVITDHRGSQPGLDRTESTTIFDAHNVARESTSVTTRVGGGSDTIVTRTTPNPLGAPDRVEVQVGSAPATTTQYSYHRSGSLFETPYVIKGASPAVPDRPATRRLHYDAFGRLEMVFLETNDPNQSNWRIYYSYDGFGRRIRRIEQQVEGPANTVVFEHQTRYVHSGDRCLEEWERNGDNEPWRLVRRYMHGPGGGEVFAVEVDEGEVGLDIDNDGSVGGFVMMGVVDDHDRSPMGLARLRYHGTRLPLFYERYFTSSFGEVSRYVIPNSGPPRLVNRSTTGAEIHKHSRWFHEREGLYYNGRRFQDPQTGQFVSRDPGGAWADPAAHGNGFTFAGNDPIGGHDPSGYALESVWDAASLGLGVYSISQWNAKTSFFDKALDVFGVAVDALALAIPFVPGGVGAGLKAYRLGRTVAGANKVSTMFDSARSAYRAIKLGKQIERGLNTLQGVDAGLNAIHSYKTFLDTGSPLAAVFAGIAGFGGLRSGRDALLGVCFPAGTPVATPDGFKKIEDVRPGDRVLCVDEPTGMEVVSTVSSVTRRTADRIMKISLRLDDRFFALEATPEHPFLVIGAHSWVPAGHLAVGDDVRVRDGIARVEAVEERMTPGITVHNLEVEGTATYLVSEAAVMVHNTCPSEERFARLAEMEDELESTWDVGVRRRDSWFEPEAHEDVLVDMGDGLYETLSRRKGRQRNVSSPAQDHHIATNKHRYWTPLFEELFERAGLDIDDVPNVLRGLAGHHHYSYMGHSFPYHQTVYNILRRRVDRFDGRDQAELTKRFGKALERIGSALRKNQSLLKRSSIQRRRWQRRSDFSTADDWANMPD